jgi:hypothetical protein
MFGLSATRLIHLAKVRATLRLSGVGLFYTHRRQRITSLRAWPQPTRSAAVLSHLTAAQRAFSLAFAITQRGAIR